MSAQSGFLNCFLKFIQGDEGEKLPPGVQPGRAPAMKSRYTITMAERKAILTASSKRLNQDQKTSEPKAEKQRKPGRPRLLKNKPVSRSSRSKGSTSEVESESQGNDGSESKSENEERLSATGEAADGGECVSGVQKTKKGRSEDEGGPSCKVEEESDDLLGGSEKMLRDRRKTSGRNTESNKKSNTDEAESAANRSSVILNCEVNITEEKGVDSSCTDSPAVAEKKKRGRKRKSDIDEDGMPRRKLSSRKAKQKARISYAESGDEEDLPGLDDNSDSDDPVWVPEEKKGSSDEGSDFRWSKYEKLHAKSKKSCSNPPVMTPSKPKEEPKELVEGKGVKQNPTDSITKKISGGDVGSGTGVKTEPVKNPAPTTLARDSNGHIKGKDNTRNLMATTKLQPIEKADLLNPNLTVMPFQSGTFIAQKSDLEEKEEPPIWRVDGKSLLQKYEPFRSESGRLWYRNVSTYSGWGPKSNLKYQEVPVKFIKQNRIETIVEIIQAELTINEDKLCEKLMKESEKHAYAYEVFVQTLVSHALDSNFLSEIIAEKDEYFLDCVEEMDRVCAEKKTKLMEACQWPKKLTESLITWPVMTLSKSEPVSQNLCTVCYACQTVTHVKMDGNPYKYTTLEYEPPSQESFKSKEFAVCLRCTERLRLFHKISHLKYHTYLEGVRMVSEMKTSDSNKNNTDILHDILADGLRVKKEFKEICLMWAQADVKSRTLKPVEERKIIIK